MRYETKTVRTSTIDQSHVLRHKTPSTTTICGSTFCVHSGMQYRHIILARTYHHLQDFQSLTPTSATACLHFCLGTLSSIPAETNGGEHGDNGGKQAETMVFEIFFCELSFKIGRPRRGDKLPYSESRACVMIEIV